MPREIEQFNERISRPTDFEKTVLKNFSEKRGECL